MSNPTFRVLVTGGRDYDHSDARRIVFGSLDAIHREREIAIVIHGGCCRRDGSLRGADRLAFEWAMRREVWQVVCPAKWTLLGKFAGPQRNRAMLLQGTPDLVVAFPGGSGTADMVARAKEVGVEVRYHK